VAEMFQAGLINEDKAREILGFPGRKYL
jgi:hypothetical protein